MINRILNGVICFLSLFPGLHMNEGVIEPWTNNKQALSSQVYINN